MEKYRLVGIFDGWLSDILQIQIAGQELVSFP
jgi:hypothetical protein